MPDLAIRRGAPPALAVESLTYRYPTADRDSLASVSLEIAPGELVLLAGRSASGKSTLLKAACGLVPHFHGGEISGAVRVAGTDALATGPGELASSVGYVAQDPETQVVSTTVSAEIGLPLEMRGDPASSRARAIEEVALALAIPHLLDRTVDSLSGGELQRVSLAAALVTRPRLVLLDEPTSQLDPVAGDELIWLLRRLNEEWGVSILLAEHRLERCLAAADRAIAMAAGTIAFDGRPADFLAWAQQSDPPLETPAARLFTLAGLTPLPVGVRDARAKLASADPLEAGGVSPSERLVLLRQQNLGRPPTIHRSKLREEGVTPPATQALRSRQVWVELPRDDALYDVLRGIDLTISGGERVALMGRNGAGKSTLLRAAAGLVEADPRDLSGGERQRLALAIALAGQMEGERLPGLVALDEPTRGMDRARKGDLVALIESLAGRGAGVVVATHDVEFAAEFAERVVLLGDGVVVADGPAAEILSGGWYFATEVARVLDIPGVVTPEQGAAALSLSDVSHRATSDKGNEERGG